MTAWDKVARETAIKTYQDSKTNSEVYDQFGQPRWLSPTFGEEIPTWNTWLEQTAESLVQVQQQMYDKLSTIIASVIPNNENETEDMTEDDPIIMMPVKQSVLERLATFDVSCDGLSMNEEYYLQAQAQSVLPKIGTLEFPVDVIRSIAASASLRDTPYAVAVGICRDWVENVDSK